MSWIQSKCFDSAAEIIHELHLKAQHLIDVTSNIDKFTDNEKTEIKTDVIKEFTRIQELYAHAITPCGLEIFAPQGKPTVIDTFRESIAKLNAEPLSNNSWLEFANVIKRIVTP